MLSTSKILLSSSLAILLSACGGSSSTLNNNDNNGAEDNNPEDNSDGTSNNILAYEGTWLGNCFNNGSTSSQTTLTFNAGAKTGTYNVRNHDGSSCGSTVNLISEFNVDISYPETHTSSVCANSSKIDLTIKEPIKITDVTGYGGFPAGTVKEYTVAEFEALTNLVGETLNTHIQLFNIVCSSDDGTKIYGGLPTSTNDGSTADKRPTELSINYPFIKQ